MHPLRLVQLALMSAPAVCLFVACSEQSSGASSTAEPISSDATATSSAASTGMGTGTGAGTGTGTGTGASTGTSTGGGYGDDAGCQGDLATWMALTQGPIPCEVNSDCCVIVNPCLSQVQVVGKDDQAAAFAAWPFCDGQCDDCNTPAVEVACVADHCVGRRLFGLPTYAPETMPHCGSEEKSLDFKGPKSTHFECGG